MNKHTEEFNRIMGRGKPTKKLKQVSVKTEGIQSRENMNAMQTDLCKCIISGNVVSLPFERLPNYDQVRKALLNAGATYSRSKFIFPNEAKPYIERLMGGESVNIKKEFQFFATPVTVADRLIKLAAIERHHKICEPEAGQGAIIEAINRVIKVCVEYFELMDINREVIEQKRLAGKIDALYLGDDFLKYAHFYSNRYDRIIANPPFNKNQDTEHILKMYDCLKPRGRIVTIASNSWRIGNQKKQVVFRNWLNELDHSIEEVEAGAFAESGTKISTCIITIDKS